MLISSRSFAEYIAMFDLLPASLAGRTVLDVAAGGSDFTAHAAAAGALAGAVDDIYARPSTQLADALRDGMAVGLGIVDHHPDRFRWDWYGDRAARDVMRRQASQAFLADRERHPGRYLAGRLPQLPFRDGAADLVLSSHLLFTWSDQLDRVWHRRSIHELARVGREVRLFPLVVQGSGDPVPWLTSAVDELRGEGYDVVKRRVPYEFQVGAEEMLVIRR